MSPIGLYINFDKPDSRRLAGEIIDFFTAQGTELLLLNAQKKALGCENVSGVTEKRFYACSACILVLGGDGTLLGVARKAARKGSPLLGINLGYVGFLVEGEAANLEGILLALTTGQYFIEERMMLYCRIFHDDGEIAKGVALNDVVLKDSDFRMMTVDARIGGDVVDIFRGDGVIVASPTGSTAYSLAAGGPVVSPQSRVMLLNPICPHRLHDRSYIVEETGIIGLTILGEGRKAIVSLDGQVNYKVQAGDRVEISVAPYRTRLIRFDQVNFYERLRDKLQKRGA